MRNVLQQPRYRQTRDAGFTLIELLVGLTVLAMLVALIPGALRIAKRAWTTSQALVSETDSASALMFVEQHLAEAMPLVETSDDGANTIAFEGRAQSLHFVATLEKRQGLRIACPEEVAFNQGFIDRKQLERIGETSGTSEYIKYVRGLA